MKAEGEARDIGLRSNPGQTKRLSSAVTIHERAGSRPNRRFTAAGNSTAPGIGGRPMRDRRDIGQGVAVPVPGRDHDGARTVLAPLSLTGRLLGSPEIRHRR